MLYAVSRTNCGARSALAGVHERVGAAIVLALALLTLTAGVAQGKVVTLGGRAYGVTPTPKATALGPAIGPLPGGRIRPFTVGGNQPLLEYGGGPLMLSSTLYLIFWGPEGSFPESYTAPIVQYARDLHADDTLTTNEFSVAELYANAAKEHITGKVEFGEDVFDTSSYPALEPSGGCTEAPCVTDAQIRSEILKEIKAKGWPTDAASEPKAEYLLYTPEGVASCIEPKVCTFTEFGFCAYHDQIKSIAPSNHVATYSDLPYMAECDSQQAPSGVGGNQDADGTLDSEIHEIVESATDPNVETGYFDEKGEEIADKCTYPTVKEAAEAYGTPLGGSLAEFTAFNQLIDGHAYYTQQMWSNAPTQTPATSEPAGCVARIGPTPSFTAPSEAKTGQIVNFDGASSYDVAHPIATYEWDYGDGSPIDIASGASAQHVYVAPGEYLAKLTVRDVAGSADASTQALPVVITGSPIASPTASIASPAEGQTFALGQTVTTSFSCAEAAAGPGIASCRDSNGAASPGALDTSAAGAHSYAVTALSLDGQSATTRIEYTVVGQSGSGGGGNPSSGTPSSSGTPPTTATPTGSNPTGSASKVGSPSKLKRALKACRKRPKKKRARCIAAAEKRFGPHRKTTKK